jgi:hypothetical protein
LKSIFAQVWKEQCRMAARTSTGSKARNELSLAYQRENETGGIRNRRKDIWSMRTNSFPDS